MALAASSNPDALGKDPDFSSMARPVGPGNTPVSSALIWGH